MEEPEYDVEDYEDFLQRHGINLARFFLGKDGGYSEETLKKIFELEEKY